MSPDPLSCIKEIDTIGWQFHYMPEFSIRLGIGGPLFQGRPQSHLQFPIFALFDGKWGNEWEMY